MGEVVCNTNYSVKMRFEAEFSLLFRGKGHRFHRFNGRFATDQQLELVSTVLFF